MNESGKCYRHPLANPIVGKTREGIRQVDIDGGKRGEEYLLRLRRVNGATSIAIPSATEPQAAHPAPPSAVMCPAHAG